MTYGQLATFKVNTEKSSIGFIQCFLRKVIGFSVCRIFQFLPIIIPIVCSFLFFVNFKILSSPFRISGWGGAITPPQGGDTKFQSVCLDFDTKGIPVVGYLGTNLEFGKCLDE